MNPYAGATTVAERRDSIYEERRLLALCPWLLGTSQTPNIQSTNIATVDAHWVCYMPARGVRLRTPHGSSTYIHIGVGFCVARSGCMGNAKASKSGTATIQTPALFRIYARTFPSTTFPARGVCRKQQKTIMEKENALQTSTSEKKLRLVRYSTKPFDGSIGDFESGGEDYEELTKEREGWFHSWGNAPFYDPHTEIWHDKTVAIIEEKGTGKIHKVQPDFLTFISE